MRVLLRSQGWGSAQVPGLKPWVIIKVNFVRRGAPWVCKRTEVRGQTEVHGRTEVRGWRCRLCLCKKWAIFWGLGEGGEDAFEFEFVGDEDLAGFAAFEGAYYAGGFELVDDAAGAVVADGEAALDEGGGAGLVGDDDAGGFFEDGVAFAEVDFAGFLAGAFSAVFGEEEGGGVAALGADVVVDALDFGGVDEGALDADEVAALVDEHVAAADEVVGAGAVEDGAAVDHGGDFEGDAGGEVGFDDAGDDVGGGALGGDDHMDADGAGELGDAGDGHFDFFAGGHDEVGKFVDDDDDVG